MKRAALAVLVVIALLAAGGAVRWRAGYQPLTIDNEAVATGRDIPFGVEHPGGALLATTMSAGGFARVDSDPSTDDEFVDHVATNYVDGQPFTFAVALHNNGRVGVTITDFDVLRRDQVGLFAVTEVRVGKRLPSGGTSVRHTDRFHAFTLRGGETRDVVFRSVMHACEHNDPGVTYGIDGLTVRYRVLGLHRSLNVPTPMMIDIEYPDGASCPRPRA